MTNQRKPKRSLIFSTLICLILVALGSGISYYAIDLVSEKMLIGFLKFAMGIMGIIWLFFMTIYNKLWDLTEIAGLNHQQHTNLEPEVKSRIGKFWTHASILSILGFLIYLPIIYFDAQVQTKITAQIATKIAIQIAIPKWSFIAAGGALACAFFYLNHLLLTLEEMREFRSHIKDSERLEKERMEILKSLKEGTEEGWKPDDQLNGFRNPPP